MIKQKNIERGIPICELDNQISAIRILTEMLHITLGKETRLHCT